MTEPKSAEPDPEGETAAGPGAPRPGPPQPPENRLQRNFERGLSLAQLTVVLPVIVLLLSGIGAFVYATVYAVHTVADIARHPFYEHNLRLFIIEIDVFLIGATLIIAAFGLYELFVSPIDPGGRGRSLPAWLEMHDLNDLKARVISMIILVTAVTFTDRPAGLRPGAPAGHPLSRRRGGHRDRRAHRVPALRLGYHPRPGLAATSTTPRWARPAGTAAASVPGAADRHRVPGEREPVLAGRARIAPGAAGCTRPGR